MADLYWSDADGTHTWEGHWSEVDEYGLVVGDPVSDPGPDDDCHQADPILNPSAADSPIALGISGTTVHTCDLPNDLEVSSGASIAGGTWHIGGTLTFDLDSELDGGTLTADGGITINRCTITAGTINSPVMGYNPNTITGGTFNASVYLQQNSTINPSTDDDAVFNDVVNLHQAASIYHGTFWKQVTLHNSASIHGGLFAMPPATATGWTGSMSGWSLLPSFNPSSYTRRRALRGL